MTNPESGEGISADFKRPLIDVLEEFPEDSIAGLDHLRIYIAERRGWSISLRIVIQNDSGDSFVLLYDLPEYHATWQCAISMTISSAQLNQNLRSLVDHIGQTRCILICAPGRSES